MTTNDLIADLMSSINPAYANQPGTESYVRRLCAEALEAQQQRIAELEAKLQATVNDAHEVECNLHRAIRQRDMWDKANTEAQQKLAEFDDKNAALRKDAERYRWLCENGDKDGGLFIGSGHVGTWGECGHYEYAYKDHADDAIDAAMAAKQQEARGEDADS